MSWDSRDIELIESQLVDTLKLGTFRVTDDREGESSSRAKVESKVESLKRSCIRGRGQQLGLIARIRLFAQKSIRGLVATRRVDRIPAGRYPRAGNSTRHRRPRGGEFFVPLRAQRCKVESPTQRSTKGSGGKGKGGNSRD